MSGYRKRIACSLLVLIVVAATVLSCPIKVQATAAVPSVDSSVESIMAVLNILLNSLAVGGATDYVANYDSDMDLLNSFIDFMWSTYPGGAPPDLDATIYLDDGTTTTIGEVLGGVEDGTFTLPNEQQWGQYRVGFGDDFASILEAWEGRGGGSGNNGSSQEPEEPKFSKMKALGISAGFMALVGDFVTSLFDDDVEGLNANIYYRVLDDFTDDKLNKQWTGNPYTASFQADYTYTYKSPYESNKHSEKMIRWFDTTVDYPVAAYYTITPNSNGSYSHYIGFYRKDSQYKWYSFTPISHYSSWEDGQIKKSNAQGSSSMDWGLSDHGSLADYNHDVNIIVSGNIPIFSTSEAAITYVTNKSGYENALNYKPYVYDYTSIIANISTVLRPWTSVQIDPSTFQKTYSGVKTAYETEVKPQVEAPTETDTGIQIQTNTETFTNTITRVITETVVQTETKTDTETGTETGTETKPGSDIGQGTNTGTSTSTTDPEEDADKYKRDLRQVFPFCLPFDLIALLEALDAEPVTPCFDFPFVVEALNINMVIKIDLSFLDDVAAMMRTFETIGFIITLITITHKLIKW